MSQKKQGFVYGALILMLSNITVKVVGALFKIPLANIIGDHAMGYFSSAYSIYSMCFLISTAGLPVAISRMIAAARAKRNLGEVDRIYRISLLLFVVVGLLGTSLLFFGAGIFADLAKTPSLSVCIQTVSPIMFFICLVSCFRGYFQGHQNMVPTAVSQVIEVMSNLLLGLSAGVFASKSGYSAPVIASFALGGITLGVVLSSFYLAFAKSVAKKDREVGLESAPRSAKTLTKELIAIAIPITISSSVMSLTSVIDSIMAVGRLDTLVDSTYFSVEGAEEIAIALYGAYQAKAVTFFNLPTTIITPFAVSIIPAISSAEAGGDRKGMEKTVDFTFRIVSVICLPCAFGLGVMAKPIIDLLFSSNAPIFQNAAGVPFFSNALAAQMLSILAPAIVFSGLISVSAAVLQASGYQWMSIISTGCGVSVKALAVWLLVGTPLLGHYGIPVSTLLSYLVMFLFNMFFLSHLLHYRLKFSGVLLIPLISAALCGGTAWGVFLLCRNFLPHSLATVGAIGLAALVYVVALFRLGGFRKDDVLMLPKGEKILRILTKVRLLKA